jgi:hypothetical protein
MTEQTRELTSTGATASDPTTGARTAPGIDWNSALLEQLTWHWETQLRPRLDGLTDAEYFWEPVEGCWSVRRAGAGDGRP